MVDGAGNDVPRCKLRALVEALHEALAVGQAQHGALAAQCLGDQEGLGFGMIQAGGVELVEFHVADPAAGSPAHGDAVAAGAIRVAGVKIGLACAAGRQDHRRRLEQIDMIAALIERIYAVTMTRCAPPDQQRRGG